MKKNSLLFLAGCIIIITVIFALTALSKRKAQQTMSAVFPEKTLAPQESVQPQEEGWLDEMVEEPRIPPGAPLDY